LNPVSFLLLSVQPSVICWQAVACAVKPDGALGGVGVGFGVAVAVGLGVAVGVGAGVDVGVGVGLGLGVAVDVGVGVGVGVVAPIWTIFATEGTPFEFKMNSM
jgi:hypothetical protein